MGGISYLCGLGNPGSEYEHTRHNLGFEALELLAERIKTAWSLEKAKVSHASGLIAGRKVTLLKPLTYMNLSGRVLARFEGISPENILVVCDDINIPLGRIRIRRAGGSGGHKGLESIEAYLGSNDFARLRMGIGPPPGPNHWNDFVLERFSNKEMVPVDSMKMKAVDAMEIIITRGIEHAMQEFNGSRES